MKKDFFKEYKNPDNRCKFPFGHKPPDYCWEYANMVNGEITREELIERCRECGYWEEI